MSKDLNNNSRRGDIDKLKEIRTGFIDVFKNFPENIRPKKIFNGWNIKDIISHLNNWLELDISHLEAIIQNKEAYWEPNVEEFNVGGIQERKNKSYSELIDEFVKLSDRIIKLYINLPDQLWDKPFSDAHTLTPALSLKEEIEHWQKHLNDIESKVTNGQ